MTADPTSAARAANSRLTRIAAIVVLVALAALAYYAMFAGPTTVPVATQPHAAPVQRAPQPPGEEGNGGEGGRFD